MKKEGVPKKSIPVSYSTNAAAMMLIDLYLQDNEFSSQFTAIGHKHAKLVPELIAEGSGTNDFERALDVANKMWRLLYSAEASNVTSAASINLPANIYQKTSGLRKDLSSLVLDFGLDYKWAVPFLTYVTIVKGAELPQTFTLSDAEHMGTVALVKSSPWKPFTFTVPAAIVLWSSDDQIIKGMRQALKVYKAELRKHIKSLDTKDALEDHVRWLFAKKRHKLSAKEIVDSQGDEEKDVNYNYISDAIRNLDKELKTAQCIA